MPLSRLLLLGAALLLAAPARASDNPAMDAEIRHIDDEWARITYQVKDQGEQLKEIDALAQQAAAVVAHYPGRAEPLLWQGVVTSEEAAIAHLFDQLGYAKAARRLFEQAEAIDPQALKGAVQMSLGVIYYRVPGFPLGFGDDDKARHYLEAALALDPDGLDTNYFYGDFLVERGDYGKARPVLAHALEAPVDPGRPVWDAGRRAEVRELLEKVDKRASR